MSPISGIIVTTSIYPDRLDRQNIDQNLKFKECLPSNCLRASDKTVTPPTDLYLVVTRLLFRMLCKFPLCINVSEWSQKC